MCFLRLLKSKKTHGSEPFNFQLNMGHRLGGSSSTLSVLQSLMLNPLIARMKDRKVVSFMANVNQADLVFMKALLEAGKVVPVIDRKYSLSDTPQAIRYVEEGHARGKVIINV